ncbi:D-alanine--D-alanine ligase [Ferrimonas lipolytica]|uniref:D-alanine--D-alanine ligase n=1 Tax=Ferrimonas lipolytica TaxID=2724191 RepID=A0A6H1UHL2_9GAMM|nr:D-alanine--D-alanine ligase [Ferrimonas lipolytica]QIZ78534.1 D-alanine--D-alanine ligase [Ferrimonas lipolytica]
MSSSRFGKVAVLFGGTSAEREVSLNSGAAVLAGLRRSGVDAHKFDPAEQPLTALANYDRAFIVLHGRGGEDGSMQGALQQLQLPYTGSGVLACAVAMDKVRTKWMWAGVGLPTAPFAVVDKSQFQPSDCDNIVNSLGLPLMVKPANEGSSVGMAKATDSESLLAAITNALQFDDSILIEAWIDGPEYTVAIIGDEVMPAIQMETDNEFYDYQAKYQSSTTRYHCPCALSEQDENELRQLALRAFKSLGCQGWGRVDVMRDSHGQWQLLEVNTVPGMTETSLVPKAAKVAGYSFDELVVNVLSMAK